MPGDGPLPARSDQRRRRNKPAGPSTIKAPATPLPPTPAPDDAWHPMAREWFESLGRSGQARFYEPSDWAMAKVWAEVLSRQLSGRISAQMIAAWSAGATELLTTEGARRRARVELERASSDEDEDASVTALDRYRADVGA